MFKKKNCKKIEKKLNKLGYILYKSINENDHGLNNKYIHEIIYYQLYNKNNELIKQFEYKVKLTEKINSYVSLKISYSEYNFLIYIYEWAQLYNLEQRSKSDSLSDKSKIL